MHSLSNRYSLPSLTLLIFLLITPAGTAGTALAQSTVSDRPRIGLALSSGGARGAARIGVLKVLERERVPIDYIAGISVC